MKKIFICAACGSLHYSDKLFCDNCNDPLDEAYEAEVQESDFNKMMQDGFLSGGHEING